MDATTAGTTAVGTTAVNSPTRQHSNENQRPSDPGRFSPGIQTSGYYNHKGPTLQEALAQISPCELDGVPTNTDVVGDFDALLASLESDDEEELSIEHEIPTVGEARAVPSVLLETSPNRGLDDAEVLSRRKRYGWNMMKEENHSHLKTFLMFFVGPIQCVMLVSQHLCPPQADFPSRLIPVKTSRFPADTTFVVGVCTGCWSARLDRSGSHCRLALTQRSCWLYSRLSSREYCQGTQEDAGTEVYSLAQRWNSGRSGCAQSRSGGHNPS